MDKADIFFNNYKESTYKKGEIILSPNESPSTVFYVKTGIVRLYTISKDGNEITFNLLKPRTYFSMMSILTDAENKYFFESLTDVVIIKCPKAEFIKFIKAEPEVLFDLSKRILSGLNGLLYSAENLLSGKAEDRISALLTILAKRFGKAGPNSKTFINLPLTHQQIANLAGLTRETTSIELEKLAKNKIISYKKRQITINDLENLTEDFDPQGI